MPSCVDLHLHSTASDGTDAPTELAVLLQTLGIHTFALTDHDTKEGINQLKSTIQRGVTLIPGIEFSCRMTNGKCHILGYGYDAEHPAFRAALAEGAALRRAKIDQRLAFLQKRGIRFPDNEIKQLYLMPSVGKPHLANMMVRFGYAKTMQEAIENTINLCHTGPTRILAKTAVQAIADAGGVPVWAHPLGGVGEKEIDPVQFEAMLDELTGYGLKGLECFYSNYSMPHCEELENIAKTRNLLISGGSDYHGKNKNIEPGTLNAADISIQPEQLTILNVLL